MSRKLKAPIQIAALAIGLALVAVSVWAYFMVPGAGRFPSAVAFGAVGWLALSVSLAYRKS